MRKVTYKKTCLPGLLWLTFILFSISIASGQQRAQTGSWGDQGDGTYRNPVLNADYPDVDVEQLGDTYYMISSKQHMSPGMVILEVSSAGMRKKKRVISTWIGLSTITTDQKHRQIINNQK